MPLLLTTIVLYIRLRLDCKLTKTYHVHFSYTASSVTNETKVHQYIIPCHLPKKNLEKKWRKWCKEKNWPICQEESQLIFDFGSFLPDPLFFHFLVHLKQECRNKNGIPSCISLRSGIFSFGQDHFFFVEHNRMVCQIRMHIRYLIFTS